MERTSRTVADYLADVEADAATGAEIAAAMGTIDEVLTAAMPGRARTVWDGVFWGGTEQTIIGYGDIVQRRSRGNSVEWFLIGLARQKNHFSLYVNAVEDRAYLGQAYADRLGKVKAGSASLTFTRLVDLDLDVLAELAAHADRITPPDERL